MASIPPSPAVNALGTPAIPYTDDFYADFNSVNRLVGIALVAITGDTTLDPLIHNNCILQVNAASDVTLTLPAAAPAGFVFSVDQVGAGKAIFAVQGAATKVARGNIDRTAGQHAQMSAYVRSNPAGNNPIYVLAGDGAIA